MLLCYLSQHRINAPNSSHTPISFVEGQADEREHLSGDEQMLPSRAGWCGKAAQNLCDTQPILQKPVPGAPVLKDVEGIPACLLV